MSAWVVEKEHIDVMLKAALEGPADNEGDTIYLDGTRWGEFYYYHGDEKRCVTRETVDEVGDMLVRENVLSVDFRYSESGRTIYYGAEQAATMEEIELPGATDYYMNRYRYTDPGFRPTVAEIVKTVGCYRYQSCEHDGWKDSEASTLCEELIAAAIHKMPGYATAPWGWGEDEVRNRNTTLTSS